VEGLAGFAREEDHEEGGPLAPGERRDGRSASPPRQAFDRVDAAIQQAWDAQQIAA
jgi:hypothetical protein